MLLLSVLRFIVPFLVEFTLTNSVVIVIAYHERTNLTPTNESFVGKHINTPQNSTHISSIKYIHIK